MLDGLPAVTEVIERREQPPVCPHCQGTHIVRNGHAGGLQRYWRRGCGRTFNALAGTALAQLHRRGKWLGPAQAMREQLSLTQVQHSAWASPARQRCAGAPASWLRPGTCARSA